MRPGRTTGVARPAACCRGREQRRRQPRTQDTFRSHISCSGARRRTRCADQSRISQLPWGGLSHFPGQLERAGEKHKKPQGPTRWPVGFAQLANHVFHSTCCSNNVAGQRTRCPSLHNGVKHVWSPHGYSRRIVLSKSWNRTGISRNKQPGLLRGCFEIKRP